MNTIINFRVGVLIACLWSLAILACGIVSGPGLLAFVSVAGMLCWLYWRVVVSRPRVQACGVYVGEFLGQSYYMEGTSW
jgi:hypothetical protein